MVNENVILQTLINGQYHIDKLIKECADIENLTILLTDYIIVDYQVYYVYRNDVGGVFSLTVSSLDQKKDVCLHLICVNNTLKLYDADGLGSLDLYRALLDTVIAISINNHVPDVEVCPVPSAMGTLYFSDGIPALLDEALCSKGFAVIEEPGKETKYHLDIAQSSDPETQLLLTAFKDIRQVIGDALIRASGTINDQFFIIFKHQVDNKAIGFKLLTGKELVNLVVRLGYDDTAQISHINSKIGNAGMIERLSFQAVIAALTAHKHTLTFDWKDIKGDDLPYYLAMLDNAGAHNDDATGKSILRFPYPLTAV